jgi:hypothetical protein
MTPTKLLGDQIPIVFAIVIAGVCVATEWCAAELGFQAKARRLVRAAGSSGRSSRAALRVVVLVRRLCTTDLQQGNRGLLRRCRLRRCDHRLVLAGAAGPSRHGLRLFLLGDRPGHRREAAGLFRSPGVFLGRFGGKDLRREEERTWRASLPSSPTHVAPTPIRARRNS